MRSVQHGRGERLERCAVNALRFVGALLARPAVRGNAAALRTFLPPMLRPILELLPGSGCIISDPIIRLNSFMPHLPYPILDLMPGSRLLTLLVTPTGTQCNWLYSQKHGPAP